VTLNKTSQEQFDLMRQMYYGYKPIAEIVKATGVKRPTVMFHIKKWKEDRELRKHEIVAALTDSKRELMSSIAKNGLEALAASMEYLNSNKKVLSLKEMQSVAQIIDSFDKITKLDDGNPTEILAEIKPSSTIEIRKLLKNDPFLGIEDAEIEETSHSEEHSDQDSESEPTA
jgi:DNA-binding transcriptional ArsR family regulator